MSNSTLREMFNFYFSRVFINKVLIKYSFLQGDSALGYHSMKFKHFPDTS